MGSNLVLFSLEVFGFAETCAITHDRQLNATMLNSSTIISGYNVPPSPQGTCPLLRSASKSMVHPTNTCTPMPSLLATEGSISQSWNRRNYIRGSAK